MKIQEKIKEIRSKIEDLERLLSKDLRPELRLKIREDIEHFEGQIKEFNRLK